MFIEGKTYLIATDCDYSKYPDLNEYTVVKVVQDKYIKFKMCDREQNSTFWVDITKPDNKYRIIQEL